MCIYMGINVVGTCTYSYAVYRGGWNPSHQISHTHSFTYSLTQLSGDFVQGDELSFLSKRWSYRLGKRTPELLTSIW